MAISLVAVLMRFEQCLPNSLRIFDVVPYNASGTFKQFTSRTYMKVSADVAQFQRSWVLVGRWCAIDVQVPITFTGQKECCLLRWMFMTDVSARTDDYGIVRAG